MAIKRITTNLIKDSDIATVDIANNAITAAKITDGNITTAKLADLGVTAGKLAGTLDLTGKTITVATATTGDSDTSPASTAFVQQEIAALVDSSPSSLNTLNELAAALGDDASFSTTVTNSIALKAPLASPTFTGDVDIDATDDLRLRFLNGSTFKAGIQVPTSTGDMISGAEVDDLAIRSQANMLFSTGGNTERMRIDSSGNVGIGTTNPTNTYGPVLHIRGANPNLRLDGTNTGSWSWISMNTADSGDSRAMGTASDGAFRITNVRDNLDSGIQFAITQAGNVGIGTSSPSSALTVQGALSVRNATQNFNGGLSAEVNSGIINFGINEGSGNRFGGSYTQANQGGFLHFDTRSGEPLFQLYGRTAGAAGATGTLLFQIDSTGNTVFNETGADADFRVESNDNASMLFVDGGNNRVGIGTDSPDANLHVNRNTNTANNVDSLGFDVAATIGNAGTNPGNHFTSGLRLFQGSGTVGSGLGVFYIGADNGAAAATNDYTGQLIAPSGMTGGIKLNAADSSGTVRFETAGSERMRITSNGGIEAATTEAKCLQLNSTHSNGPYLSFQESGSSKFYIGKRSAVGGTSGTGYDLYAAGNYDIAFYTNAARRWSINTSGHFTPNNQHTYDIGGVNAEVRNIYAQGISFASNANASGMTSELLDDYEEGTWTPVLGNTGGTTATHGTQVGQYTKIGNLVHAHGTITTTAGANFGGSTVIFGLPFTSMSAGGTRNVGSLGAMQGAGTEAEKLRLVLDPNRTYIFLIKQTGQSYSHDAALNAAVNMYGFSIVYSAA
ncbi:hypothetical protein N9I79_01810 [Gammaproteobacteria bacterium]|nr:hypothetical protein [Gammaproteobacteria bacterium]